MHGQQNIKKKDLVGARLRVMVTLQWTLPQTITRIMQHTDLNTSFDSKQDKTRQERYI